MGLDIREKHPGIKLVLMTGWIGVKDEVKDVFNLFLTKPLSLTDVLRIAELARPEVS